MIKRIKFCMLSFCALRYFRGALLTRLKQYAPLLVKVQNQQDAQHLEYSPGRGLSHPVRVFRLPLVFQVDDNHDAFQTFLDIDHLGNRLHQTKTCLQLMSPVIEPQVHKQCCI
jgi:hypothetical protein